MTVFWDVAVYSLVEIDRYFIGAYCLHHQGDEMMEVPSAFETYVRFQVLTAASMMFRSCLLGYTAV
jgi:esterase/lipase superfamily enzyme